MSDGQAVFLHLDVMDGFIEDAGGSFDWTEPDEEVNSFINGRMRQFGTFLYGRRMYDAMKVWEAHDFLQGRPGHMRDFGDVWRSADRIVYSQSISEVSTARTHLGREFDADAPRALKAASAQDLAIEGPNRRLSLRRGSRPRYARRSA